MASQSAPSPASKGNLVCVVGTTGVGKSQLAIDLALAIKSGEIINSDSMQVYNGLDIITNKATKEEMKGVPHHLMGFLEPGQEYKVGDFQRDALEKISELHGKYTLPIVVGGTTYYVQHLIFPNQLVSDATAEPLRPTTPDTSPPPSSLSFLSPKSASAISHFPPSLLSRITTLPPELLSLFFLHPNLPSTSSPSSFPPSFPSQLLPPSLQKPEAFAAGLYNTLLHVDPFSASRWHWRDIRKVRRALDITWEGRLWQDVLDAQMVRKDEGARFRTLVFWLYAEPEVLNERLDKRVDKMLELGLLEEIEGLWSSAAAENSETSLDYSRGVYQAIGFKEFEPFLSARTQRQAPPPPSSSSATSDAKSAPASDPFFKDGLERMKVSTRQYAKKQIKWVKQNLIPAARASADEDVFVYLLDATNLVTWDENVRAPALRILASFLANEPLQDPLSLSNLAAHHLAPPSAKGPRVGETFDFEGSFGEEEEGSETSGGDSVWEAEDEEAGCSLRKVECSSTGYLDALQFLSTQNFAFIFRRHVNLT
ncbi:tRNA dimethylallyltransferase, partial [Phenoliferia sp. Uapishka_3]